MSLHTVLVWVVFLVRTDLENMITLVFSVFSLILHLAHHIAKFKGPVAKGLSWKSIVQYYQQTGTVSFACGAVLGGH